MENQIYDREKEVRKFDETKAGVKGLVDGGIQKIPPFFVIPEGYDHLDRDASTPITNLEIPVIDLKRLRDGDRKSAVDQLRDVSATWGFFQVVNHGVPKEIMEEMIGVVRRFHDLPKEEKMEYYSIDSKRKVKYNSNMPFSLWFFNKNSLSLLKKEKNSNTIIANSKKPFDWKDTLFFNMSPDAPHPQEFPPVCSREVVSEYDSHVKGLGATIFELLAEALGLKPNHLIDMECGKDTSLFCNYYPPCPEPTRTFGIYAHRDSTFITILLQDHLGGLQAHVQNQWIHVPPIPGALLVNFGNLLQLLSNDKLKSTLHRVLANKTSPRISIASFFFPQFNQLNQIYGPIKELLSDDKNPRLYRDILLSEYAAARLTGNQINASPLDHFRL